ncbi:transient receptor potential cation channel protein painless-like [Bradysia coprophila]|uniref:transient receptor potential cation channel protein painless-like n=1 Tax=Bradysia coprophila TaxID=38358 RepID=UPI00187DB58B|nr:transient receptor potential cation channel protein painless-like [Bradysia coprophila]
MTESNVLNDLKSFRSKLFEIDLDEPCSQADLKGILDEYLDHHFEVFCEEYLIAGFDVTLLNDKTRAKVTQLTPDGVIPSIRNRDVTYWEHDRLLFSLMFDNEDVFVEALQMIAEQKNEELAQFHVDSSSDDSDKEDGDIETLDAWRDVSLIRIATLRDLNLATEALGALNEEFNRSAIHSIYRFGRWQCLKKLLEKRKSMSWKPVRLADFTTFLMQAQTIDSDCRDTEDGKVAFGKCVDLLLNYANYGVNEQNEDDYSALHLAVQYSKTTVVHDLLKNGAFIGMQDCTNRPAISHVDPKALKSHFDRCISGEDMIVLNFENLISPSDDYPNDMEAIRFMSKSYELRHLLEHPLIACFLFLKWQRLALLLYTDCLCYFMLSLITGCVSMYYIMSPAAHTGKMCFLTLIFSTYTASRRLLQIIFCSPDYRKSQDNYANSFLTFITILSLVLFVVAVPMEFHTPTMAAISIVLITYEFFNLSGTFWHFSIYSEMLIAVTKSSIKSLQLYAIFLPAFSLLFYILLRDPDDDRDPPDFNKFPSLGMSMIKTVVMSAGEFDVANVDFDSNTFGAYVFVGFIFLISTVFMNLLNGLAVSDTQKIQAKAELTSFIRRCQVLARYEEVLSRKQHWFRSKYRRVWRLCKYFTHINTFVYDGKKIFIDLEDSYMVYAEQEVPPNFVCLRVPLRSWARCRIARMSKKIVHAALRIRDRNEMKKHRKITDDEHEREQLAKRIDAIESTLKTMEETLKLINDKLSER